MNKSGTSKGMIAVADGSRRGLHRFMRQRFPQGDFFSCRNCRNRNIRAFASVYGKGTRTSIFLKGRVFKHDYSKTRTQNLLAEKCAPPRRWPVVPFIVLLVVAIAGMMYALPIDILRTIEAYSGFAGVAGLMTSTFYNLTIFRRDFAKWSASFYCDRCGTVTVHQQLKT